MKRIVLAVLGLGAAVTLGGVAYAGYTVYQTTEHAVAAVSSFKSHIPNLKPPAGMKPGTGRSGSTRPVAFPFAPTPGTGTAPGRTTTYTHRYTHPTSYRYPYVRPTAQPGSTHPFPYYRPARPTSTYHPHRP